MNDFQARFARRFGCTVDVLSGREFNDIGQRADHGGSCATCGGCSRKYGDVGLAAEGVTLENSVASGLELRWKCPGCGRDTYAETTILNSSKDAQECLDDPLCYSCRKKPASTRQSVL